MYGRTVFSTVCLVLIWIQSIGYSHSHQLPERHIQPRPKPADSPVPDRFYQRDLNINPHPYRYTLNNEDLCDVEEVYLLMLIRSAPAHLDRRQAIRDTWGSTVPSSNTGRPIKLGFLFGQTSAREQRKLELESLVHKDIIQENFLDSYQNLTIKDVTAYKWTTQYCHQAKFVMVGSDEILVDMRKLLHFLDNVQDHNIDNQFVLCHLYPCCTRVYRDHPKYNVSKMKYESPAFPAYCSGTAYVTKPYLLEQLYYMSLDTPSFMPDDAWIGVMAEKINAQFHDSYKSFTGIRNAPTVLNDLNDPKYAGSDVIIAVLDYDFPGREAKMMRKLWRKMLSHHEVAKRRKTELENDYQHQYRIVLLACFSLLLFLVYVFHKNRFIRRRMNAFTNWRP